MAPVQAAEVEASHDLFLNVLFQGVICHLSLSDSPATVTLTEGHGLDVLDHSLGWFKPKM